VSYLIGFWLPLAGLAVLIFMLGQLQMTKVIDAATVVMAISALAAAAAAIYSAVAAVTSAEVAKRALEGVERPVLLVSMPRDIAIPTSKKLDPHKVPYGIFVKNIGKQVAKLIPSPTSNYVIQRDSTPPAVEPTLWRNQDTACPIFFIGEIIVTPDNGQGFWCQRSVELTPAEIAGLNNESLFGFSRVGFIYADPVGTLRISFYIFLLRPQ
jgi:hypothetical protein